MSLGLRHWLLMYCETGVDDADKLPVEFWASRLPSCGSEESNAVGGMLYASIKYDVSS